jgi:hypothetical protein
MGVCGGQEMKPKAAAAGRGLTTREKGKPAGQSSRTKWGTYMRIQIAAVGVAGVLALGLAPAPAASAAPARTGPAVGETVLKHGTWHKYEAVYWSRPGRIALIEPDGREVSGLQWFSWTRTGGIANGVLRQAGGCCGAAAVVSVSRPRNGHFTRMSITTQQTQKFWWPAVIKKSTVREWRAS